MASSAAAVIPFPARANDAARAEVLYRAYHGAAAEAARLFPLPASDVAHERKLAIAREIALLRPSEITGLVLLDVLGVA